IVGALVSKEPLRLGPFPPETPGGLIRLIEQLLNKDPARRPASAQLVADALAGLNVDEPPSAQASACEAPLAAAEATPRGRSRWLCSAVGPPALVVVGILVLNALAPRSEELGTLPLDTVGPGVVVHVMRHGQEVAVLDGKTNPEITLPAGSYEVEL